MNQDQIVAISNFLNTQADLPVEIAAIAEELKAQISPTPISEAPVVDVAAPVSPSEEVAAPTVAPSEEAATE